MSINTIFGNTFNYITKYLEYNPKWLDHREYFNGAIKGEHVIQIGYGEMAKSIDPIGRRIIFIGTRIGTICVFDRFMPKTKNYGEFFILNSTEDLMNAGWVLSELLNEEKMILILGIGGYNLGCRIENLYKIFKNL